MKPTERKFRVKRPSRSIENVEVIPGQEVETWAEALEWLSHITPERLHSFRIQINYKPAALDAKGPIDGQ